MADHTIGRLSLGYDQMLGRRFEQGVDLSGGEWQKVALARAYLRDAQLLILDEPPPRWTRAANLKSSTASRNLQPERWRFLFRTGSQPYVRLTAS